MKDLSLHILDIVQNSVVAQASNIEIRIEVDKKNDYLAIIITDNGKGMSPEFLQSVTDPYTTTRTTR
jgi:signal transduction histidine kinase